MTGLPTGAPRAVVIGASMAGLLAAAALERAGHAVTVVERDRLPERPAYRRGVPQDQQAHVLLHRGAVLIERLLPGFRARLVELGAVTYDSTQMPWLSEHGWLEVRPGGHEVLSATRPTLEAAVRQLLRARPRVDWRDGTTVTGLDRGDGGWTVRTGTGDLAAAVVVDASGRASRLPQWLPWLGSPAEERVDARVGYATRRFVDRDGRVPLRSAVILISRPDTGTGGLALPVEDNQWVVAAAGAGPRRPPRDETGWSRFLAELPDPALADLVALLEPVDEIHVHRQTANVRRHWERVRRWPPGLLVLGDALCCFNPIYGQGMTVAAEQAAVLAAALERGRPVDRRLQRRLAGAVDAPWAIATAADLRSPVCADRPGLLQRWVIGWTDRLWVRAAAGDRRATEALFAVNQLTASPLTLLHPRLLTALGPAPRRRCPRPGVLDRLSPPPPRPVVPAGA